MPDVLTEELTYDEIVDLLLNRDITVDEARGLVNPAEKERLETLLKYIPSLQPTQTPVTGVQQPSDKNVDDWGYKIGDVIQEGTVDGRPVRLIYEGSGYGRLYVYQDAFGDVPAGYYPQQGATARPVEKRVPKAAETYNRIPKEEVPEGWTNIGGNFYRAAPEKGELTGAVMLAQVNETTGRWYWQPIKPAVKAPKAGYYETAQEAFAANPGAGEEDLRHDENGFFILPKAAKVPTKWPAGYEPGSIIKDPVSGAYGQYVDDGTGSGNVRFNVTTQATPPTAPPAPKAWGKGTAPDGQPLETIRTRPDGSSYYYILDANNNAVVADVSPATELTPLQRAQKQDADAKWLMEYQATSDRERRQAAETAETRRSQRAQAAENRGWEMSQASLADVRQRERDAATMAWNQQQARATAEAEAARAAEDKRRYGASLQANPMSWIESNVYNQTTPAVQPWMIPLSEGRYSMADVGKPVVQPEAGGIETPTDVEVARMVQRSGSNPQVWQDILGQRATANLPEPTASTAPLTPAEINYAKANMYGNSYRQWTPQGLPALSAPSAQAWARMGPTERAMYGSYEKARTGIPYEDLQRRLWATTTPGQGGGGVRRRY